VKLRSHGLVTRRRIAFSGIDGYGVRVAFASTRGTTPGRQARQPAGLLTERHVGGVCLERAAEGDGDRRSDPPPLSRNHVGDSLVWPGDSIFYVAETVEMASSLSARPQCKPTARGRRTPLSFPAEHKNQDLGTRGTHLMVNAYRSRLGLSSIGLESDLGNRSRVAAHARNRLGPRPPLFAPTAAPCVRAQLKQAV